MREAMNQETDLSKLPCPEAIGPYAIIRTIGRGGMGEVYLAKDPSCGRELALKRIRPDLSKNQTVMNRFLREARVAGQLTHPSIIPILSIQNTPPDIYYTMPYVEGDTLRQILKARTPRSIPTLARIFLQICEAIAYTHSKGVLHRDLKPENIIVGKYGEVMILDWGIADFISALDEDEGPNLEHLGEGEEDLTLPGKIAGTLAYMAPERLFGETSSVQADIYALGVMLYYILTLQVPFQRKSIAAFRKNVKNERLIDPIERAPYRDIPHQLAAVCHKCLASSTKDRFKNMEELIEAIKGFIEGEAQWIPMASLHPNQPEDWQFQENILLAKHIAITRELDETEWAALMISRKNFANNIRLEMQIKLDPKSLGIGLLLSMPSLEGRKMLEEGYCLWIKENECFLYRNNVQVFSAPLHVSLSEWRRLTIEKVEDVLQFSLDGTSILTYASHLPLPGAHIGLLHKDSLFELEAIEVFDASHHAYVRCLAVPNAFLSHKLYDLALEDYRRIGHSFPGRQEGREALFRAGIAILEKGKAKRNKQEREQCFHRALKEFGNLYRTSGAPLEYLGKSLVYDALGEPEEEAKCLELSLRKFPKHPLLPILRDHITYRMHESSGEERSIAYRIILLGLRHIPNLLDNSATRALVESLERNLEELPFLEYPKEVETDRLSHLSIVLSFLLAKPLTIAEIIASVIKEKLPHARLIVENALFCLLELEATSLFEKQLAKLPPDLLTEEGHSYLTSAFHLHLPPLPDLVSRKEARLVCHLLRKALSQRNFREVEELLPEIVKRTWQPEDKPIMDALIAWFYCMRRNWKAAGTLLNSYPLEAIKEEESPLFFPYACWLYGTEGPGSAKTHFSSVYDTPYPNTYALPSHFLLGRINGKKGWIERAFWWEKKELYRQLDFFYYSIGKKRL
jgi:serine/threonine-protein kinase